MPGLRFEAIGRKHRLWSVAPNLLSIARKVFPTTGLDLRSPPLGLQNTSLYPRRPNITSAPFLLACLSTRRNGSACTFSQQVAKKLPGFSTIAGLTATTLHGHTQATGKMLQCYPGSNLVDVLSSGPPGTAEDFPQVILDKLKPFFKGTVHP